jgi:hypothetical protein
VSNYQEGAREALTNFPTLSDVHKTARAIRAAQFVPDLARTLGLTQARLALADQFKVSERMIRRYEYISKVPEIAQIVAEGRVVVDTAEKIMKSAKHAGLDILTIAWWSAPLKDRQAFLNMDREEDDNGSVKCGRTHQAGA